MAYKQFQLAGGIGDVIVYKRRGTRSIRLTVDHSGRVKVSMPAWMPYRTGLSYAASKQDWLLRQMTDRRPKLIRNSQSVGKSHRVLFTIDFTTTSVRSRLLSNGDIIVRHPVTMTAEDPAVQMVAERACLRALRREAEDLLPARLGKLAERHKMMYKTFGVKKLKGRWGSCDQNKHITMNLFVMQLPWELIDYVLLHELTHTEHLDHGSNFWRQLESMAPGARSTSKRLRGFQPVIFSLED